MDRFELLAPAKNILTAYAAINSGCDAIYIGANSFGARQNASNSLDDIKKIVDYAHKFYVKVFVTINTILDDKELSLAKSLIKQLYDFGVDALIIQDMGLLQSFIDGELPPIPIHMSTQCNNRTLEKVKFFDDMGIQRVILARELSLDKIKEICNNTSCEIETFVHGALCVSYSGQCYMSCSNGGRSANRGECAQSCRKKYTLVNEDGKIYAKDKYLLSLKDFNASKYLKNLVDIGVKSFKIEGRLKDENYVKNVVLYYRNELDKICKKSSSGKVFADFEPDLNKSFNRGFTTYFLNDREKCFNFDTPKSLGEKLGKIIKVSKDYFEIDAEISPQDGLCYMLNDSLSGCLVNKVVGKKVYPNKMDKLKQGTIVYRNFNAKFEKQLINSKIKRRIGVTFTYKDKTLYALDEDFNQISLPVEFNEVTKNQSKMQENFVSQLNKIGESDFYIENIEIQEDLPFIPVSEINNIRRNILEKLMEERIRNYKKNVQQEIEYATYPEKEVDYRANIHNEKSKKFYELSNSVVKSMSYEKTKPSGVELMRTKHCLKYAFNMCKSPEKLFLIDEKGRKYKLNFDCKNCEMSVIDIA